MRIWLWMVLAVFATSGCARLTGPGGYVDHYSQQRKLSEAVSYLEQGKPEAAEAALDSITAGPSVPGVSDEALFRLSLLRLGDDQKPGGIAQAQQDLRRLITDYPASSWSEISRRLSKTLAGSDGRIKQYQKLSTLQDSLKKESIELKSSNHSLFLKNRELRGSNLSLAEESRKQLELINSLTKENAELRRTIDQLKALDLDLEKKIKR